MDPRVLVSTSRARPGMREPSEVFLDPLRQQILLAYLEEKQLEGEHVALAIIVPEQMQVTIASAPSGDGWWITVTCMSASTSADVRLAFHELMERRSVTLTAAGTPLQARIG